MVAEDPHAAAARLDAECLGWRLWYGNATGHFFAVRVGARVMVEAKTTSDLIEKINRHQAADQARTSATQSPASSPPTRLQKDEEVVGSIPPPRRKVAGQGPVSELGNQALLMIVG